MSIGPFLSGYQIGVLITYHTALIVGVIIYLAGFVIRWTAVYQLGKMFTVDVVIHDQHTLKISGLYRLVRHPSYLGLMLIITGLAVCFNGLLVFLVMVVPVFLALNHRIFIEEQALVEEFGHQYLIYRSRVKRLVPLIY